MKRLVRYKLKPECVEENERYIRDVFAALHQARPRGLRYAAFRLPDGVSFMHLVSHEADDGNHSNLLVALPAFKAFVADIRARCEEPPKTVELQDIGAYGFFSDPD